MSSAKMYGVRALTGFHNLYSRDGETEAHRREDTSSQGHTAKWCQSSDEESGFRSPSPKCFPLIPITKIW